MKYFAKIKYLGTAFHGFQFQPELRTVQGELTRACEECLGVSVRVTGSSRTDAGVHANGFCITIDADGATVPPEKLPLAIAKFLPEDISLFYAKVIDSDFHPRYDSKSKEYLYRIYNAQVADPFERGRSWFLPRIIDDASLDLMRRAAEKIIGKHDFSAFMSAGSDVEDTVRTVHSISLERVGSVINVRVRADGFLYNMVRIIVGTLVEVAFNRFSPDDIPAIIESGDRLRAGMCAPADGLYLDSVEY